MKRFHVNVAVADLAQSIEFYNTLFGQQPEVRKDDYAKWMLDDPRVNFSVSESSRVSGINHVGLQADTMEELGEIQRRLRAAGEQTYEQPQEVIRLYYGDERLLKSVENAVLEEQVVDWVVDNVKVSDKAMSFNDVINAAAQGGKAA